MTQTLVAMADLPDLEVSLELLAILICIIKFILRLSFLLEQVALRE